MPGTHVTYDCTEIYRRSLAGYASNYDCIEIYRRSQRGYRCGYDCTEIYRRSQRGYRCSYDSTEIYRDDDEEDEEGAKMSFKIAENQICISLEYKFV